MNRLSRQFRWSVLILLAFPLFLAGQEYPRRFFRGDATSRPWGWGMRSMMEATGLRLNHQEIGNVDPTEAQWKEISEYMKRELPNAWELYEHQTPARQAGMRRQIFARFQATQALRQSNQVELYNLRLREQKLLDQTAGLVKQWRRAPLDEKAAIRKQIRGKAQEIVQVSLQEQELRIKHLEAQLAEAKNRLAQDRSNLETLAERRSNRILDQATPVAEEADQMAVPTTQSSESNDR